MVSTGLSVWTISSQPGVRTLEVNPVRELDAANPHVQFDEREMETDLLFAGTAPSLDSNEMNLESNSLLGNLPCP
jgi:hypothetical protein